MPNLSHLNLYDRIGGAKTIDNLVDSFYAKVLADEEVSPFFRNTPVEKLRNMQHDIFSIATDSPEVYDGSPIGKTRGGKFMNKRELGILTEHLIDTLKEVGVKESDAYEIISHVNLFADEITHDAEFGVD
ncbi:MAG: group 1 truncated hemoglobin [Verrucomicrobiota bacterium]